MTHLTLTDERLRQTLSELGAGPDATQLIGEVLRTVDALPQQPASRLDLGGRRTVVLLVAATLLLAVLIGALALVGKPPPLPPQTERTLTFDRPFEYVRPAGLDLGVTRGLDGLGLDSAYALEMMRRLYAPCPDGCPVGALDTPVPLTHAEELEYGRHLNDWNIELSALMTSFTLGGTGGDRGVIVALPSRAPFGYAFWCFGPVTDPAAPTAGDVLDLYGAEPWGQALAGAEATTFDGHEAVSVRSPAGRCPTSHPSERQAVLPQPGVLTLVQLDDEVVVVAIWGATDATLDEWLPTGTEFISTFHFVPEEST